MKKVRDIIAKALQPGDSGFLEGYRGREIEFYMDRGRKYPEKLAEVFAAIAEAKYSDLVVIGPRGGGKTMAVYDAAGKRFLWDGDDVFGIGGSESQARNGYAYVRQIIAGEKKLQDALQEELKTCAVGATGNWFKVAPSSSKQVRGPHPGDPHEGTGWQAHGGVLIKDERDEMDDEIAAAADASMGAADPGMVITTSTMHRADGGGIAQLAEEAEARGAHVIKFDIFDVSETCVHDCASCPGGRKFAGPLWGVNAQTDTDKHGQAQTDTDRHGRKSKCLTQRRGGAEGAEGPGKTLRPVPEPTVESTVAWGQFKRETGFPQDEPGYCEGRAKMHAPGHVRMKTIFDAYKRAPNDEVFEVEFCCRKRRGARRVVDGVALDRCLSEDVYYEPQYETPIITIDWGFAGWTVLCLVQRQGDHKIAVVDVRYEHMQTTDVIVGICQEWQAATGAYQVAADASHPFQNAELAKVGFEVTEIPFVKYKEFGAGWIKGIVERGQLRIKGKLFAGKSAHATSSREFYSSAEEELFNQLKKWQRDKNGKIVKKDDHGPDSLSCAAVLFSESVDWEPEFLGTGVRDAFGVGGIG